MAKIRSLAPWTLAVALAAPGLALAASLVDHDGDGRISRIEYRAAVARIAETADTNADGLITPDEFPFTPADLALFDNNADGAVTSVPVQEFIDGMDLAFDAMDADMDEYLSAAELAAANGRYGIAAPVSMRGDQAASAKPRPLSRGWTSGSRPRNRR